MDFLFQFLFVFQARCTVTVDCNLTVYLANEYSVVNFKMMTIVVLDEEYPEYALSQQEVVPVTVQPPRAGSIYSIEDRFVPRSHALTSLSPSHQVHHDDDPDEDYPEDGHEPGSRFTVKHEQTEYEYIVKGMD